MPDVTTQAVIEGGVLNGDGVQVSEQVHDMRDRCLPHRHLLVRHLLERFRCVVGACPTTLWSEDIGTHPGGEAVEVSADPVTEGEVPGLVLEIQSRRNVVALFVLSNHVHNLVYKEGRVAGHLRKPMGHMQHNSKSVGPAAGECMPWAAQCFRGHAWARHDFMFMSWVTGDNV